MNKITMFWIAIVLLLVFTACFRTASAQGTTSATQQYDPENDFIFERIDNNRAIMITGHIGDNSEVSIPPSIQGLPVTSILFPIPVHDYFFNFTSVTIPESVTSIGEEGAFLFPLILTAINVAPGNPQFSSIDGVLYDRAQRVLIQYPPVRIGTSFTIPNSVTFIGAYAFCYANLTSITIPDSVTTIGDKAFASSNLTSITIPESVTSIGEEALSSFNLTAINVAPNNSRYSSLDGILYDKAQRSLIQYPAGKRGTTFNIPDSIRTIGSYAISHSNLTSITIPNSVTSIGAYAFSHSNLTSITIPNSVTTIGAGAFWDCTSLTSVTFNGMMIPNYSDTIYHELLWFPITVFPGDLCEKYRRGGAGTYTRQPDGEVWTRRR